MDALLAVSDRRRAQGCRDYALLLFLYNTGARATEAAELTVADLNLGTSPAARLHGKGRKIRTCPLWARTAKILHEEIGSRLEGPSVARVFLNVRRQPITRHGVHALIARTVDKAAEVVPSLQDKRVSPLLFAAVNGLQLSDYLDPSGGLSRCWTFVLPGPVSTGPGMG